MLNRTEDTGSTRTLKLARRPGIGQRRVSPKSVSQASNDYSGIFVASNGEKTITEGGAELLSHVGIVELLQQDERPTFIVDLEDDNNTSSSQLNLLFANPPLNAQSALLESIEGKSNDLTLIFATSTPHREFRSWVLSSTGVSGTSGKSATPFVFAGFTWRFSTMRNCLRVVCADTDTVNVVANEKRTGPNLQQLLGPGSSSPRSARETRQDAAGYFDSTVMDRGQVGTPGRISVLYQDSLKDRSSESSQEDPYLSKYSSSPTANGDMGISDILASGIDSISSGSGQKVVFPVRLNIEEVPATTKIAPSEPGFFDWTRLPVTPALPSHIQFARSIDWAATSLGWSWS